MNLPNSIQINATQCNSIHFNADEYTVMHLNAAQCNLKQTMHMLMFWTMQALRWISKTQCSQQLSKYISLLRPQIVGHWSQVRPRRDARSVNNLHSKWILRRCKIKLIFKTAKSCPKYTLKKHYKTIVILIVGPKYMKNMCFNQLDLMDFEKSKICEISSLLYGEFASGSRNFNNSIKCFPWKLGTCLQHANCLRTIPDPRNP